MLEEFSPGVFGEKAANGEIFVEMKPGVLILKAKAGSLPNSLGLDQIALLIGADYHSFLDFITSEPVRIAFDSSLTMVISKADYKEYLISKNRWPLPQDCLLSNWWLDGENKPWLIADIRDETASEVWQTAARYFYRQHKKANPELLKKDIVSLVMEDLKKHQLYKRGGEKLPSRAAADKILQNIEI